MIPEANLAFDAATRPRAASEALILAIETAGPVCSAALARGECIVAAETRPMRHGHAEAILPLIDRVMRAAGQSVAAMDGVAVSTGPGGFTGIRVGLAAAHGIALATRSKLIGVTVFEAIAASVESHLPDRAEALLAAIDSRRAELYLQLFTGRGISLSDPAALLPEQIPGYVGNTIGTAPLLVAGDAASAAMETLAGRPGTRSATEPGCDARAVALAAIRRLRAGAPLPSARPFYLRPPDVTLAKRANAAAAADNR